MNEMKPPVPATTEPERTEEANISDADYSTTESGCQMLNFSDAQERRLKQRMNRLSNAVEKANRMKADGASAAAISEMLNGATRTLKPLLTQAALESVLSDLGITVRFNRVTHEVEFSGVRRRWPKLKESDYYSAIPIKLRDMVFEHFKDATRNNIEDLLGVVSLENGFNPILELIKAEPWDSVNRFPELYGIMGVTDTDELSKTLIHKWTLQAVSLLHNTLERDYSADGMLCLQSRAQGIGKTRLASALAMRPRWFRDGAKYNPNNKDSIIETVGYFVAEFGELERILKPSQMEDFKLFITSSNDEYRISYGRRASRNPRMTSFIGTCNSAEFLIDDENRRFWVIPIREINLDALERFDAVQFWRGAYQEWKREEAKGRGGVCYRLTPPEKAALKARNVLFQASLDGQSEVESIIEPAREDKSGEFVWAWSNVSDWMERNPVLTERRLSSRTVIAALNRLDIAKNEKAVRSGINGSPIAKGKARLLPFRHGEVKRVVEETEML